MRHYLLICLVLIFFVTIAQPSATVTQDEVFTRTVAQMSLEEKVGQLFMAAFREENGKPVTAVTQTVKEEIQKYHLGGVILFRENFADIEQTVKLSSDLQQAAGASPLFIAVDQEGGRVNRFSFGTNLPGNMALGASGKDSNAYIAGSILGQELNSLGINLDLAPALDINSNQDNPVIGLRSFGADAKIVGAMGAKYIQGLHDYGVMSAIKHFPGHGDTSIDSHLGLPCVLADKSYLDAVELTPFRKNLFAADMVMAAHIAFPSLDNTTVISQKDGQPVFVPASLSYKILTELLRGNFGYDGVIITDALEMKAISDHFGPQQAVVQAIEAGADILLMPSDLPKAYTGVLEAIKSGVISEERLNQSVKRILRLKQQRIKRSGLSDSALMEAAHKIVGSKEHKDLENKLAAEAVTMLKNEESVLPLKEGKVVLFAPWQEILDGMREKAFLGMAQNHVQKFISFNYENVSELTVAQKAAIENTDYIILATYSSTLADRIPGKTPAASFAAALARYADKTGKKLIVMAIGTPYDILYLPEAKAYLAVYGANQANIHAGMTAIFGAVSPSGKLPVAIADKGQILYKIGSGLHY
ncbi:MAG: glycoside hydrolase family 3 protein [Pelosinus sp.]|nr:glycoside hydrolase family 3 protein [Pelosinus sp.]